MLIIRGTQDIYISRGDTKNIAVNLVEITSDGTSDYVMADREFVILKVWDKDFRKVLKTVKSAEGESVIHLIAPFTADMCGSFTYSVDLIFADGTKETIIGKDSARAPKFVVLEA